MFGKVVAWLRGDDLSPSKGAHNVSEQQSEQSSAAEAATGAGIIGVDGTPTTPEGQPVGAAATAPAAAEQQGSSTQASPGDPQAEAAAQLAAIYKSLPGVVPALIGGATVAEVQQSLEASKQQFADIRAALLVEQGLGVPQAHAGTGGKPVPADAFEMIKQGVSGAK